MSDQLTSNITLLERRIDNLTGHFSTLADLNAANGHITELQSRQMKLEAFRDNAMSAISGLRER